jgi:hypothetical protein
VSIVGKQTYIDVHMLKAKDGNRAGLHLKPNIGAYLLSRLYDLLVVVALDELHRLGVF